MKKQLLLISALFALLACNREACEDYTELRASFAPATKISLDAGLNTVWNSGDKVSVFYRGSTFNRTFTYKGEDGAASGPLRCSGKLSSKEALTLAAVPYNKDFKRSGDVLCVTIPSEQKFVSGVFDPDAAVLAAASEDDNLPFGYVPAFLAVKVENLSDQFSVGKVELSSAGGELLAGDVSVSFADSLSAEVTKGVSSVSMEGSADSPLVTLRSSGEETFVFAVAPVKLAEGYVFKVYPSGGGDPAVIKSTSSIELRPGTLRTITGCVSSGLYEIDIDLTTSSSLSPALPTSSKVSDASGDAYTVTNSDGKKYELRICDTSNGYRFTGSCLRLNDGSVTPYTGWIALPCVSSKKLVKIGIKVRNDAGKALAVSSDTTGGGDVLDSHKFQDETLEYVNLSGTKKGTVYYLTDSEKNLQIKRLELFYE